MPLLDAGPPAIVPRLLVHDIARQLPVRHGLGEDRSEARQDFADQCTRPPLFDQHIAKAGERAGCQVTELMVADERLHVQIEVLAILAHCRAFEAVALGLCDPLLAGNGDGRAAMRWRVDPLLDLDERVCQPCTGFLFGREGLRAPPLLNVGSCAGFWMPAITRV